MVSLIGKKIGMTQVFSEDGSMVPVTVLKFDPNFVVGQRLPEKNGYSAVVLGTGAMKERRASKPFLGQFPEGVGPMKHVMEVRNFGREVSVGDELGVDVFDDSVYVDIQGISKGKGFQGVMRRYNFTGGSKTHGSKFHRGPGATGMAATPSRIHKGTKMPGRMGGEKVTVQNLRIVRIDADNRLLLVRGAVPGARNATVVVSAAAKKS